MEQRVQNLEKKQQGITTDLSYLYDAFLTQGLGELAPDLTIRLKSLIDRSLENGENGSPVGVQGSDSSGLDFHDDSSAERSSASRSCDGNFQQELTHTFTPGSDNTTNTASTVPQNFVEQQGLPLVQQTQNFLGKDSGFAPYKGNALVPVPLYVDCIGWTSSYAFTEKTFGRRIQRVALEAAAEMFHKPFLNPNVFPAIFGFCMLWESREEIRDRMFKLASRSASETLDDWSFPFADLGGAGKLSSTVPLDKVPHGVPGQPGYLPIGNYGWPKTAGGKAAYRSGSFMGPFSADVESTRDSYLDQQMHMRFPEFEGHFYDPNDTELYLRLRGIVIPPQVDFVTAEIDLEDFQASPEDNEAQDGSYSKPFKSTGDWTGIEALLHDAFLSRTEWKADSRDADMFPQMSFAPPSMGMHQMPGVNPSGPRGRKVKVSIDVDILATGEVTHFPAATVSPPRHILMQFA